MSKKPGRKTLETFWAKLRYGRFTGNRYWKDDWLQNTCPHNGEIWKFHEYERWPEGEEGTMRVCSICGSTLKEKND